MASALNADILSSQAVLIYLTLQVVLALPDIDGYTIITNVKYLNLTVSQMRTTILISSPALRKITPVKKYVQACPTLLT